MRHASMKDDVPVWEVCIYSRGEQAKSRVLQGLEVSVTEIFEDLVETTDKTDRY